MAAMGIACLGLMYIYRAYTQLPSTAGIQWRRLFMRLLIRCLKLAGAGAGVHYRENYNPRPVSAARPAAHGRWRPCATAASHVRLLLLLLLLLGPMLRPWAA